MRQSDTERCPWCFMPTPIRVRRRYEFEFVCPHCETAWLVAWDREQAAPHVGAEVQPSHVLGAEP